MRLPIDTFTPGRGSDSFDLKIFPFNVVIPTANTLSFTREDFDTLMPSIVAVPVILISDSPAGVEADVVIVRIEPELIEADLGLKVKLAPMGMPDTKRSTSPVKLFGPMEAIVIPYEASFPWTEAAIDGPAEMEKSCLALTVKGVWLWALPSLVITVIGPVVAPMGTLVVIVLAVNLVIVAFIPLKVTCVGALSRLLPVMVTVVPIGPEDGVNPVIVGGGFTVKTWVMVVVPPGVVTEIGPVVAPCGTFTVSVVAVALSTWARMPLNLTIFLDGIGSKSDPLMVTCVPTAPDVGLKLVMVGGRATMKLCVLVADPPGVVTVMGPLVAAFGTETVRVVAVVVVTDASTLSKKNTLLLEMVSASKPSPEIVTMVPGGPCVGEKPVIEGAGKVVKLLVNGTKGFPLISVMPFKAMVYVVPGDNLASGIKKARSPDSPGLTIPGTTPAGPVRVRLDGDNVVTFIGSEKRIEMIAFRNTFVARLAGLIERTRGGVISVAGGP